MFYLLSDASHYFTQWWGVMFEHNKEDKGKAGKQHAYCRQYNNVCIHPLMNFMSDSTTSTLEAETHNDVTIDTANAASVGNGARDVIIIPKY
ncbi:hypothetical protein SLEP1_g6560 [Rubroshorea leprosula]|uniref:Uncharacterized protein n=1 Tax=Rubroshorea leprosula TaxID=152421 RepID=A0AAV5I4T4_9ROSI|nr:hypothetical protein SLEP1_g6560 [Rubroshorea leprosula]